MLEEHGRVALPMNIRSWVEEALTKPGISPAPLTPEIAIESSNLPGTLHGVLEA
jgi:PIN domain nuclease of toxin-antitoxin system